jgi:hypothetical protein
MRRRISILAVLALTAGGALGFSGCGEEHGTEAVEGQPLHLGELIYNVQITRFLNPDNVEDANYLEGQPTPEPGEEYLGVFIRINNEDDEEAHSIPDEFEIVDTRGNTFEALETESPFALEFGAEVPPDGEIPAFDTPARSGPIKGAMLLFLLSDESVENRPIALEIPEADGAEAGSIDLDL